MRLFFITLLIFSLCNITAMEELTSNLHNLELYKIEHTDHFRDIKKRLVQYIHPDNHLQNLKQWILDQIEIPSKTITTSGECSLSSLHNKYGVKIITENIEIYENKQLIRTIAVPHNLPKSRVVSISYDGKWLNFEDEKNNCTIHIVNTETGELFKTLSDYGWVGLWSPNNKWLLIREKENIIKLFDIETYEEKIIDVGDLSQWIVGAVLTIDNKYLAIESTASNPSIILWNLQNNSFIKQLSIEHKDIIKWLKNEFTLILQNNAQNSLHLFDCTTIFQIDDYFNNKINSLEEFMLLKEIDQARLNSTQYKLSKEEQIIFNNICNNNPEVGDAIRRELSPFVEQIAINKLM